MEKINFDAVQQAIQHYRKEGYIFDFTEETISEENPADWDIEVIHTFKDAQSTFRSHILYVLNSSVNNRKGIIVRRFGMLALPFKAHFLQQVELSNTLRSTPSV